MANYYGDYLTPAQQEVIDYLREHPDASYAEMAEGLYKSRYTIEQQVHHIYKRLDISGSFCRVQLFIKLGWFTPHNGDTVHEVLQSLRQAIGD